MFEPHNIGKQPTDTHSKVLEEILITIAKHNNGGRNVELIRGDNHKDTNGKREPNPPGSLDVDPHQKDADGNCVTDSGNEKILMTATEEGKAMCLVQMEEKKSFVNVNFEMH